ncbi:unnamed protein product [Symbiodinium sp. KB8]|nr:unnamed protein product [Symbiodinium sp. KB8]
MQAGATDLPSVAGISSPGFKLQMSKGVNVAFIPGGFLDAVAFEFGKDVCVLRNKKGFIKYCLQFGYRAHPCYTFGECETYHTFSGMKSLRMKIALSQAASVQQRGQRAAEPSRAMNLRPVLLLALCGAASAAGNSQDHEKADETAVYIYDNPPMLLRIFWIVGSICAVLAVGVSMYNIKQHAACAHLQGFGQDELISSFGARASRIMKLLLMPLTFAVTAALQMFLPGAAELLALLRTCQLALSMNVIIELLFILNGSQKQIVAHLPEEPIAVFGKPPLCCIFGWGCCAQKVQLWHLRFFVFGLQQFMVILPVVGLIDSFNQSYAESNLFATTVKACGIIVTVSTLFGMWSFKCLLPLMTDSIRTSAASQSKLDAMEQFLLLQMMSSKLMDKLLPLLVKNDLQAEGWTMPNALFLQVLTGFLTCIIQFLLATLGLRAYEAGAGLYPPVNFATDLPPDTLALLDMDGIDPDRWGSVARVQARQALVELCALCAATSWPSLAQAWSLGEAESKRKLIGRCHG